MIHHPKSETARDLGVVINTVYRRTTPRRSELRYVEAVGKDVVSDPSHPYYQRPCVRFRLVYQGDAPILGRSLPVPFEMFRRWLAAYETRIDRDLTDWARETLAEERSLPPEELTEEAAA